jgi:hypothetical protein
MNAKWFPTVFVVPLSALIFPALSAGQTPNSATTSSAAPATGVASLPITGAAKRPLPQFLRAGGQSPTASAGQATASRGFTLVNVMVTKNQAAGIPQKSNGIDYHGGLIMDDANGVNVYFIWYGNWSNETVTQTIVTDFIKHLGGSPYTTVNTTYYDLELGPAGKNVVKDWVTTGIHYMGSTTDNYSFGSVLGDQEVGNILGNNIGSTLPYDPKGVYFVLTSADVTETSGFCQTYCAFHGYVTDPATGINFPGAFVGNPEQCPIACAEEAALPTPNNSVAADGMVNMIAHELEESVTDPFGDAWWNSVTGEENEDMCLFTFGKTYNLPNGSYANMKLGDRNYLIQRNWVNKQGGYCALKWDD